jgi:hypothetical protein
MNREEYMDMMCEASEAEDLVLYGGDNYFECITTEFECVTAEDEWEHCGPDDPEWIEITN